MARRSKYDYYGDYYREKWNDWNENEVSRHYAYRKTSGRYPVQAVTRADITKRRAEINRKAVSRQAEMRPVAPPAPAKPLRAVEEGKIALSARAQRRPLFGFVEFKNKAKEEMTYTLLSAPLIMGAIVTGVDAPGFFKLGSIGLAGLVAALPFRRHKLIKESERRAWRLLARPDVVPSSEPVFAYPLFAAEKEVGVVGDEPVIFFHAAIYSWQTGYDAQWRRVTDDLGDAVPSVYVKVEDGVEVAAEAWMIFQSMLDEVNANFYRSTAPGLGLAAGDTEDALAEGRSLAELLPGGVPVRRA